MFAAILVREHEIVAVVGIAPSSGPPSASPLPPDEASLAHNWFKQVNFTGFPVLANPDTQDTYFKRVRESIHCVLAPTGMSHWPNVLKNAWHGMTIK